MPHRFFDKKTTLNLITIMILIAINLVLLKVNFDIYSNLDDNGYYNNNALATEVFLSSIAIFIVPFEVWTIIFLFISNKKKHLAFAGLFLTLISVYLILLDPSKYFL